MPNLTKLFCFQAGKTGWILFLDKVGYMGLFFAYIRHNTPWLFAFGPPEWEKNNMMHLSWLKKLFFMIM
jgi:hypothetical protein